MISLIGILIFWDLRLEDLPIEIPLNSIKKLWSYQLPKLIKKCKNDEFKRLFLSWIWYVTIITKCNILRTSWETRRKVKQVSLLLTQIHENFYSFVMGKVWLVTFLQYSVRIWRSFACESSPQGTYAQASFFFGVHSTFAEEIDERSSWKIIGATCQKKIFHTWTSQTSDWIWSWP